MKLRNTRLYTLKGYTTPICCQICQERRKHSFGCICFKSSKKKYFNYSYSQYFDSRISCFVVSLWLFLRCSCHLRCSYDATINVTLSVNYREDERFTVYHPWVTSLMARDTVRGFRRTL